MSYSTLSNEQVEQFMERGWVKLEQAFSREQALAAQGFLWQKLEALGFMRDDRATWTKPMVHVMENYADDVFQQCQTERLTSAIEDLVGENRWRGKGKATSWGWWPVNFSVGAEEPWVVPTAGWHWDGQHFRHSVDAPDQGLLLLPMFSEIESRGGGTLIAEGSHQVVARLLAHYPDGVEHPEALERCPREHPWLAELTGIVPGAQGEARNQKFFAETTDENGTRLRVIEAMSELGDVFLCHPFLYHAPSQNHRGVPRFMCNRTTPLTERLQIHQLRADASPLERSIHDALVVSALYSQ